MSSNLTTAEKARPVVTYGKKLHTDIEPAPASINNTQKSSGFLFGADDEGDDEESENFFGKSIFDKPTRAPLDSIAVTTVLDVVSSPSRDDFEMPDMPLTPRSKLAAELKRFEEDQQQNKPKKVIYKTPFKLIGLEDDESEEESDDAFMERFKQQMKDRDAEKANKNSTSTIEDTVSNNSASSIASNLPASPSTTAPDASVAANKSEFTHIVPKISSFPNFSDDEKESDISDSEDEKNLFVHRANPPSVLASLPAIVPETESTPKKKDALTPPLNHLLTEDGSDNEKYPGTTPLTEKTKKVCVSKSYHFYLSGY
jgi:hypothetical protein